MVAYLYPGYKSYKTLSQRPANEADIQRWLMYWSVIGCVVAIESAEWVVNWLVHHPNDSRMRSWSLTLIPPIDRLFNCPLCRIPLYYPAKTIFILYLVLPQTEGSSYLYAHHLQPFFHAYEPQIDATLSSLKARSYAFIQEKLRGLWGTVAFSITQPAGSNDLNEGLQDHAMNRSAPPHMQDPASGPANLMGSLLNSFGPNILLQSMAFMNSAQNAAATRTAETRRQNLETPGNSRLNIHDRRGSDEPAERKDAQGYQVDSPPIGTGRFEEVDFPSDAENENGQDYPRPAQGRSSSWFGWGSNTAGYERVKSD